MKSKKYSKYVYDGKIVSFGRIICNNFHGETMARSPEEAKRNIIFQYKYEHKLVAECKIGLSGEVEEVWS